MTEILEACEQLALDAFNVSNLGLYKKLYKITKKNYKILFYACQDNSIVILHKKCFIIALKRTKVNFKNILTNLQCESCEVKKKWYVVCPDSKNLMCKTCLKAQS